MELRYDGRVAVVTGAGRGLGREYALFLASRGAKVLVNDLGEQVAQQVVDEIVKAGGVGLANGDSVLEGDKVIKKAVEAWGRIDILINNAGIAIPGAFHTKKDKTWNKVMDIHLLGSFKCTRAAWNTMREQGYGRIINTSSLLGLYADKWISDYATAKSGLNGFTMSLALEGAKRNILTNSIAPLAITRMTDTNQVFQPYREHLPPSAIVPLVAYLSHQSCQENGGIFQSAGGWTAKVRWQRSEGLRFEPDRLTPESVRDNFGKICSFEGRNQYPSYDPNWGNKVNQWMKKATL